MRTEKRCQWVTEDPLYIQYHDQEWGVPIHNDQRLFEFLILEGVQAGLSWLTVLKRRENYRLVFDHFDANKIARYTPRHVAAILKDPRIIRNRLKVEAAVINANAFLQVQSHFSSFADYLWQFVEGRPIQNQWQYHRQIPTQTLLSDKLSKDLKQRGFKFVGSTICYAYMQAIGMVNDHLIDCFRYEPLRNLP